MAVWKVTHEETGMKLTAFLRLKLNSELSLKKIKLLLAQNKCLINKKFEHFGVTLVGKGDLVELVLEDQFPRPIREISDCLPKVIYNDDSLIAIDKPAYITSDNSKFLERISKNYKFKAELIHRLDKETTGVLLIAKNSDSLKAYIELFKTHNIKKSYLAIVDGIPNQKKGTISNYLGKIHSYQGQSLWGPQPKEKGLAAVSNWKVIKTGKQAALLQVEPITGRTHQIRVHLQSIGHPILGDKQYGKKSSYLAERCLLHAESIDFVHPFSGKNMHLTSCLPQDFTDALRALSIL